MTFHVCVGWGAFGFGSSSNRKFERLQLNHDSLSQWTLKKSLNFIFPTNYRIPKTFKSLAIGQVSPLHDPVDMVITTHVITSTSPKVCHFPPLKVGRFFRAPVKLAKFQTGLKGPKRGILTRK